MLKRFIAMKYALPVLLILVFVAGSVAGQSASQSTSSCQAVKPSQIVNEIIKGLRAEFPDKGFREKNLNFNITCTTGKIVKIKGGVKTADDFVKVINGVVKNIPHFQCIKGIDVLEFSSDGPGSCGSGQQRCNGGCIGPDEKCNRIE